MHMLKRLSGHLEIFVCDQKLTAINIADIMLHSGVILRVTRIFILKKDYEFLLLTTIPIQAYNLVHESVN